MARPRKDSGQPEAKRRLIDAFWTLLETTHLHDITVGMITAAAHCNRGTFYYHYADIDALVYSAVRELLLGDGTVPKTIFELVAGSDADDPLARATLDGRFRRFALIMQEGEMRRVDAMVKSIVTGMWESALCHDGERLTPEARLIIEHAASGILGVVTFANANPDARGSCTPAPVLRSYLRESSLLMFSHLCRAQHLTPEEFAARLGASADRTPLAAAIASDAGARGSLAAPRTS